MNFVKYYIYGSGSKPYKSNGLVVRETGFRQGIIDMTDTVSTDDNIAAIVSAQNLAAEYRPYHVRSGNYMIWYDFAVIRLSHFQQCKSFTFSSSVPSS